MKTVIVIILTLLNIASILSMIFILLYNRLQLIKIRKDEAQESIIKEIENRYNLIMNTKKIIQKNTKMDLNIYTELDNLKNSATVTSYELEKKITEAESVILLIKNDYPKLNDKKDFKETIRKIKESDTKINAEKSYYNKNCKKLNDDISKFPINLIAFILKIKKDAYYEETEMFKEFEENFDI